MAFHRACLPFSHEDSNARLRRFKYGLQVILVVGVIPDVIYRFPRLQLIHAA